MTDEQIIEIGKRHFREGHKPEAIPNFVAAVRECLDEARRTVSGQEAQPNWKALHAAADAVAASADIWAGFSTQDAKVCVDAYLTAPTPERADLSPEARAFYARHETRMGRCGPVAPERADADTVGAGDLEALLADVTAIDTRYRGSPSYEHDANWFKDRVIRLLEKRIAADASERADAEKDAARYQWILENADVLFKRAEFFNGIYSHYPATHEVSEAIDAAILAADKEKKS
jgi:hypothetical protein